MIHLQRVYMYCCLLWLVRLLRLLCSMTQLLERKERILILNGEADIDDDNDCDQAPLDDAVSANFGATKPPLLGIKKATKPEKCRIERICFIKRDTNA